MRECPHASLILRAAVTNPSAVSISGSTVRTRSTNSTARIRGSPSWTKTLIASREAFVGPSASEGVLSGSCTTSTLSCSSKTMVSAVRLPISGSERRVSTSFSAMAAAMVGIGNCSAHNALRYPMPFTEVNSSKNSRSSRELKPTNRGR